MKVSLGQQKCWKGEEQQFEFLRNAQIEYWKRLGEIQATLPGPWWELVLKKKCFWREPFYKRQKTKVVWLHELYCRGWNQGALNIEYSLFEKIVKERLRPEDVWRKKRRKRHRWSRKWAWSKLRFGEHRKGTKYQKPSWPNDPKDHEQKIAWREESGKERERRKSGFRRGPGHWWKKERARTHRAWVKQNLRQKNWDAFRPDEYKIFCDCWLWS